MPKHTQTRRKTPPSSAPRPLSPAPQPGQHVRIPLNQLHAYLIEHGLKITRRIDTDEPGGWYIEMQEETPA